MSFCLLCNKAFVSERNLKIHEQRLHQVCTPPTFMCNFCHTGFNNFSHYEDHYSARLKRSLSKKSKKKNNFEAAENKRFLLTRPHLTPTDTATDTATAIPSISTPTSPITKFDEEDDNKENIDF